MPELICRYWDDAQKCLVEVFEAADDGGKQLIEENIKPLMADLIRKADRSCRRGVESKGDR